MPIQGYDDNVCNLEAIERVTKLVASGRALCFVGAGLSVELRYPTWKQLVQKLEDLVVKLHGIGRIDKLRKELIANNKDPSDLTEWSRGLKEVLEGDTPGAYREFIHDEFDETEPPFCDIHRALVGLPFQHFLTTNYDPILECAEATVYGRRERHFVWTQRDEVARLLRTLDVDGSVRRIFHIHGRFDNIESIVLTSDEFDRCYARKGIMRNAMWAILSTKSLVFFGFRFSLDDVYVEIVKRSKADLQEFSPSHFAFLPMIKERFPDQEFRKEKRLSFRNQHGVEPIFYEVEVTTSGEEDHSALIRLTLEMSQQIHSAVAFGTPPDSASTRPSDSRGPKSEDAGPTRGSNIIRADMALKFKYSRSVKK